VSASACFKGKYVRTWTGQLVLAMAVPATVNERQWEGDCSGGRGTPQNGASLAYSATTPLARNFSSQWMW
jgi:hypothetical protein